MINYGKNDIIVFSVHVERHGVNIKSETFWSRIGDHYNGL